MKQYFLILGLILFLSPLKAQVNISDSVANFYMEEHDRAKILAKEVLEKDKLISNKEQQLVIKDLMIKSYIADSVTFRKIIGTKNSELAFRDKDLQFANHELKRQKRIKIAIIVAVVLEHVGILILVL